MPCFAGLDTAKLTTKICVIDDGGVIVKEGVVPTDPSSIVGFLRGQRRRYVRIGMESWAIAPWLYVGLARARLPIICIEARHASTILKAARSNKTDKNDARGIAEIMRSGVYKSVHIKSAASREVRAFLTVRRFLSVRLVEIENLLGGVLLDFGLKLTKSGGRRTYERRLKKLTASKPFLSHCVDPLLRLRRATLKELEIAEKHVRQTAASDPVCRRLMTAPGVGPIVALTYRSAIDEPLRFPRSRDVAAHLGLTPRSKQSGELDRKGHISRRGDKAARSALVIAAWQQLRRTAKQSWLKDWANQVAARRGPMKAVVATARRLAVILHRMWVTDTDFRWTAPLPTRPTI